MFTSDVAYLHSIGKKVIISIGGANGLVQLTTAGARDNFVNSVKNIISTYGLDGLDIDFENQCLHVEQTVTYLDGSWMIGPPKTEKSRRYQNESG